jgi:glycerol-3-phosphate dehydrogenase subunit C
MQREGNLEPTQRHPLDWMNPDFYNEELTLHEMERVFDACHGCRRCVSLCQAFPTLFDLVDESTTMEVDGVAKKDYAKVADQCYLCDVCFETKCPYVPPHPWNLDFPHLMLRYKAIQFKQGTETKFRDTQLSNTVRNGKLASIPVVVQTVNALGKNKVARALTEKVLGVHKDAWLPEFTSKPLPSHAPKSSAHPVVDGKKSPGKVAIYSTCYVNYNEPGIGLDFMAVLEHNKIPYVLVEKQACCGMPKLELGDLDSVAANKAKNIPKLAALAKDGYAIIGLIPSCTLMFKQELPLMFPDCEDTQWVKDAMFDPFEYLELRKKDGLLNTDFKQALGSISYHVACHLRVQNIGLKTRDFLQNILDTQVNTIERCSGHAGTYGVKKEFHDNAMKIGKPVFRAVAEQQPDWIASDCQLAGHHIEDGLKGLMDTTDKLAHPITLVRKAYGI